MLGLVRHAREVNNSLADLALFFASLLDPLIQGLQHPCIDCGDHIYGGSHSSSVNPAFLRRRRRRSIHGSQSRSIATVIPMSRLFALQITADHLLPL